MDERRRYRRIPLECPIVLFAKNGKSYQGSVVDISEGGLLADLKGQENPKEIEYFRIEVTRGEPAFIIEADAQIARESPEGFVGLLVLQTDQESLADLRRLIELNLGDSEAAGSEIDKW